MLQGIEFALDPNGDGSISDAVDVINMSLGMAYGQIQDDLAEASAIAVELGVIVVAAAGNDADRPYVVQRRLQPQRPARRWVIGFSHADLNSGNAILTAPLSALGLTPDRAFDFSVFALTTTLPGVFVHRSESKTSICLR